MVLGQPSNTSPSAVDQFHDIATWEKVKRQGATEEAKKSGQEPRQNREAAMKNGHEISHRGTLKVILQLYLMLAVAEEYLNLKYNHQGLHGQHILRCTCYWGALHVGGLLDGWSTFMVRPHFLSRFTVTRATQQLSCVELRTFTTIHCCIHFNCPA